LKNFILGLCMSNEARRLTNYPFLGITERVVQVLEENADKDKLGGPVYSHILYSYHISRSNYRQAASAMYHYADRLSREAVGNTKQSLQQQSLCYSACVGALRLVNEDFQYIPHVRPEVTASVLDGSQHMEEEDAGDEVENIELQDIQKKMLLTQANLRLITADAEYQASAHPNVGDVLSDLSKAGLFELAIEVGLAHSIGLEPVFLELTRKSMKMEDANVVAKAHSSLSQLQRFLQLLKNPADAVHYHLYAASQMLYIDSEVKLPAWLVLFLEKNRALEKLLRVYMQFGVIDEAANTAAALLRGAERDLKVPNAYVCLPHRMIDDVINALQLIQKHADKHKMRQTSLDTLKGKEKELREGIREHLKRVLVAPEQE